MASLDESKESILAAPWRSRFLLGLGFICVTLAIAFAIRTAGVAIDDFYITYRYAWHLAHGDGLVFNLGERVFGLSNPGLALVLAGLHWVTGARIEILATVVFAVALLGIVACLLRSAPDRDPWSEILLGGVLFLSSPFVWKAQGSETSLALFLLLASALFAERRPLLAGLLGGAAVWVRPDTGLGLAVLGLLLIQATRRLPWRWAITAATVILAGALAAHAWFGTVLPVTFESKRYLAEISGGSGFVGHSFWGAGLSTGLQLCGVWGGVLLLIGLVALPRIFRRWGLCGQVLTGYGALNALVYPVLGVPFSIWYVLPFAAAILFGSGAALGSAVRRALKTKPTGWSERFLFGALAAAVAVALVGSLAWNLSWLRGFAELPRQRAYEQAALWIRQNSAPNESIAFGEIGMLGYTSDRTVEDLMGLVTPRSLPYVAKRDLLGAFLAHPTPLVLFHTERRSTRPIVSQPWFQRAYREVARFPQSDGGGDVVVFRRVPGEPIPLPRPPRG